MTKQEEMKQEIIQKIKDKIKNIKQIKSSAEDYYWAMNLDKKLEIYEEFLKDLESLV